MMKRTKCILGIVTALCLIPAGCGRKAALYDSEETAQEAERTADGEAESGMENLEDAGICVYVCGEVRRPGVYELTAESRIGDAVEAAGGMTEEAADTWLNLAEHMKDGQKIEVPSKEQAEELVMEAEKQENGLVNLNTATAEQLRELSGIGESKAEDILNYREQHGGFQAIEELMQIPGIKERVFEKIKDRITV